MNTKWSPQHGRMIEVPAPAPRYYSPSYPVPLCLPDRQTEPITARHATPAVAVISEEKHDGHRAEQMEIARREQQRRKAERNQQRRKAQRQKQREQHRAIPIVLPQPVKVYERK